MLGVLRCCRWANCGLNRRHYANQLKEMKYLNVAEKNDAAKTISRLLANGSEHRREGYSVYNKVFDFEAQVRGQNAKMVMTSVSGHLMQLEFQVSYRNWRTVDPRSLFDAPIKKSVGESYAPIKRTLEREIRGCQGLIIWTDCDREGENIGFEIIEVCRGIKPNLKVYRASFSEITSAAVRRALQQLGEPDKRQSDAVDVRSELDLRTGASITRFQTMRLQRLFPENIADKLISYGSCQIPTLGFVAERYKEVEAFVSEPFWKVKVLHTIEDLTVEFNWARNRLFNKEECENYLMLCLAEPAPRALVENVTVKPKHKWRPTPMDTVEMEKMGSRKLKLSAKETMTIAEKLYSKGFISYPRTETNQFTKEFNLVPLVELHRDHSDWGAFAQRVLDWGPNPRNGNKSDQAHPPIHPIKAAINLQGNEARVYEMVVRHFLACVSKDAVGSETIVNIDIAGEKFSANGLVIHERNYLDVYVYEKWNAKQIHHYERDQRFEPTEVSLHEGATTAPPLLTEADLIALMDKHGIGTDATHAEHIATIKERGYIGVIDKGFLVPGVIGMGLYEGYDAMELALAKPLLRAEFESDLKLICLGQKDPKLVLSEQIAKYKVAYQQITDKITAMDDKIAHRINETPAATTVAVGNGNAGQENVSNMQQELFQCPKCDEAPLALKARKNQQGWFIGCLNFPDCKNVVWLPSECKEITVLDECCPTCGNGQRMLKFRLSTPYYRGLFNTPQGWYKTCLPCDELFRNTFNINLENVKRVGRIVGVGGSSGPGPGPGGGGPGGGGPGGGGPGGGGPSGRRGGSSGNGGGWGSGNSGAGRGWGSGNGGGASSTSVTKPAPKTQKPPPAATKSKPPPQPKPKKVVKNSSVNAAGGIRNYFTTSNTPPPTNTENLDGFFDSNDGFEEEMLAVVDSLESSNVPTARTAAPVLINNQAELDDIAAAFAADDDAEFEALAGLDTSLSGWIQVQNKAEEEPMLWGSRARAAAAPTPPPKPAAKRVCLESHDGDNLDASPVLCTGCHQPARQMTVRRNGHNQGRLFYKCPKPKECKFFQWADELPAPPSSAITGTSTRVGDSSWGSGGGGTSSTRGGDSSWGSGSTSSARAGDSSWGTNRVATLPSTSGNSGSAQMRSNSSSTVTITKTVSTQSSSDGTEVQCACGQLASKLTVRKDGPNQGRPFYACPIREKSCGFFQWADTDENQGTTSWGSGRNGPSSSRSGSKGDGAGGTGSKTRRCGLCRQEGHTRNKCPRKTDFDF
ncbi:DNA topoisomerase 3-alpha [Drosophila tropicalis]|uniref:DNA topoisomerase 3-alpha n=1 Tax=Drosophila tropicalis TaxID=46794 RepID=UPI0035AC2082